MVASEHVVAEQTAARADLTCAAVGVDVDAVAFKLGAKAPVAVMMEEVQLERLASASNWVRKPEHEELIPEGMREFCDSSQLPLLYR